MTSRDADTATVRLHRALYTEEAITEAAETFAKRAEMGGWEEEAWYARLQEARCRRRLGDEGGFLKAALAALNQRLAPDAVNRIAQKLGRTVRIGAPPPTAPVADIPAAPVQTPSTVADKSAPAVGNKPTLQKPSGNKALAVQGRKVQDGQQDRPDRQLDAQRVGPEPFPGFSAQAELPEGHSHEQRAAARILRCGVRYASPGVQPSSSIFRTRHSASVW